jgi:hypothetical protein
MRFFFVLNPSAHKRNKYQGKIAKAQWKGMKSQRKAQRIAGHQIDPAQQEQLAMARAERAARVNVALSGATDHSMPWWREPTLASLIGRRQARHG